MDVPQRVLCVDRPQQRQRRRRGSARAVVGAQWPRRQTYKEQAAVSLFFLSLTKGGDETWIYCYMSARKQQSSVWVFEDDSKPTKLRQARSVGKKMIGFFFSKTGPVCTIPLEERKTVNYEWYNTICLLSLLEKVREKRSRSRILLLHDNVSPHTSNKTMSFFTSENAKFVTY
ncbi:hypothetical protein EVAR_16142_1 [Eumeta japonica]|uniref:Mariner Mos1 transposase n=1 Tax=Eumeta variegata TaxID=151549 RepID=A0A4C1WBP3_EUMVA|nr:hypothetical protein EVAR_16142_1 [Eumeta japonica]